MRLEQVGAGGEQFVVGEHPLGQGVEDAQRVVGSGLALEGGVLLVDQR
jgi:hypothetical protein